MKIRKGFVSNSSSSSFIVLGTSFDNENEEVARLLGKTVEEVEDGEKLIAYVGDKEHIATVAEAEVVYNALEAVMKDKEATIVVLPYFVKLEKIKFTEGVKDEN